MHELRQQILAKLMQGDDSRYRDLRPKEIDGNLFSYHLRELTKERLIEKIHNRYRLTASGIRYVSALSLKNFQPRIQPKIVTLIACKNSADEWLLYKRSRLPFKGLFGFPYGKIHLGEKVSEAAEREFEEKTGLKAELQHLGEVYLTVFRGKELISHMLCHIFVGTEPVGSLLERSEIGECFWAKITNPTARQFFPGFSEIYEFVLEGNPFFAEIKKTIS